MDSVKQRSLRLLMVVQLTQRFLGGIVSPILAIFIKGQGLTLSQVGARAPLRLFHKGKQGERSGYYERNIRAKEIRKSRTWMSTT